MEEEPVVECNRCKQPMYFMGTKRLHEGPKAAPFIPFGDFFENVEEFDLYACTCRAVEFFIPE